MNVVKRSGKVVPFERNKIRMAIEAVMHQTDQSSEVFGELNSLTNRVVSKVKEHYEQPHVEQIQDIVEETLIEAGYINMARSYIRYREQHAQKRKEWLKGDLPLAMWERKYQHEGESFEQFFDRVAGSDLDARKLIKSKKFIPAGRILANRGLPEQGIKVSYSNCYVTTPPEDNLESIIDAGKKAARTFSYGGGTGIDISKLRPKGSRVNNAAKTTSGSTSFLDIYDVLSNVIGQKGRRAALMVSMSIEHPDILHFIKKKRDLNSITKANMSVRITDKFIEALREGRDHKTFFKVKDTGEIIEKVFPASKILNEIAYGMWYSGEPGCLFWDRINSWNLLSEDEEFSFAGTNPCSEEPLPAGGSCNLGAINLTKFVSNPYTDDAIFHFSAFADAVRKAVIFLNDVLDEGIDYHPLAEQRESVKQLRQIGLGQMGFGSTLIMLGIRYGSYEAAEFILELGELMINKALEQSALLAKERGFFPQFSHEVLKSPFLQANAWDSTMRLIEDYGLRNSHLLTIAPTGSTSNLVGVSGGIEPIYSIKYKRKTETLHHEDTEYELFDKTVRDLMEAKGIENEEDLPDYVVDAHTIHPRERIQMQSMWQRFIDASISSTINLPNDATLQDVIDIIITSWESGLKGITVYRDGCAREGILSGKSSGTKKEMTEQEFIDALVCPNCKTDLIAVEGCFKCISCEFSACS